METETQVLDFPDLEVLAVESFRRRAIEAVRAHVKKYDDHRIGCLVKCIPEIIESLPATEEEVGHHGS